MITVGFDFGTHQTKVCYERVEQGTTFYDVIRFKKTNGQDALTLPSFIHVRPNGTLRYGHDAVSDRAGGRAITYFKPLVFSWTAGKMDIAEAEKWAVLYLAYVILKLDEKLGTTKYTVQMGMPTDADPVHYGFCKRQAIKVMASAMLMARHVFKNNLGNFLQTPHSVLADAASQCMAHVPTDIREARKLFPIFVFPEAYVALIPLIKDHRLPSVGPNLFVDIGGGTVDISLFTSQMDFSTGEERPFLYYFDSVPYGLNMITRQDPATSHNVQISKSQVTWDCSRRFEEEMKKAVNKMIALLKGKYVAAGKDSFMPFLNFCAQVLDGRPICYSGGGSMFQQLRLPLDRNSGGVIYGFSHVTTVSALINQAKLGVDEHMFHVLATAFALSHQKLLNNKADEPDQIQLVPLERLFGELRHHSLVLTSVGVMLADKWKPKKPKTW